VDDNGVSEGPPEDLTCQKTVELITDYLEETMPTEDRKRFEAHLEGCRGCERYLNQMRVTIDLLARLGT
jgi:hypothetical protein